MRRNDRSPWPCSTNALAKRKEHQHDRAEDEWNIDREPRYLRHNDANYAFLPAPSLQLDLAEAQCELLQWLCVLSQHYGGDSLFVPPFACPAWSLDQMVYVQARRLDETLNTILRQSTALWSHMAGVPQVPVQAVQSAPATEGSPHATATPPPMPFHTGTGYTGMWAPRWCLECFATETPMWRTGPHGHGTCVAVMTGPRAHF